MYIFDPLVGLKNNYQLTNENLYFKVNNYTTIINIIFY